ncbi:unnamed protein product [Caenorhabditis brenneri]
MMDVTTPQDSGRYSGESDSPQTDGEEPGEVSMEGELIVVDSARKLSILSEEVFDNLSILASNHPTTSEVPTLKQQKFSVGKQKRRKYSKFFFLFTTAQIEYLESMFSKNGTIAPKVVKCLADGNETNVRDRKRMENMSGLMMDIEDN